MSTYIPKNENKYSQTHAHCNGYNLNKCKSCFRLYLKESLEQMEIERPAVLKPIFHKEKDECMMYVKIDECKDEVKEIERLIESMKEEEMENAENSATEGEDERNG